MTATVSEGFEAALLEEYRRVSVALHAARRQVSDLEPKAVALSAVIRVYRIQDANLRLEPLSVLTARKRRIKKGP